MTDAATLHANHPTDDDLDLLRAGLLDEDFARRAGLLAHLKGCAHCHARFDRWQRVVEALPPGEPAGLAQELAQRRYLALTKRGLDRRRRIAPLAIAASVLAAVAAVGLWRTTEPTRAPTVAQIAPTEDVPDVYADLDFYLWMEKRGEKSDGQEHQS